MKEEKKGNPPPANRRTGHFPEPSQPRSSDVLLPKKNSTFEMLYETGNIRLARAIERTEKVIKSHKYCKCSSETPRSLRRKGRVWICSLCGGWIPYNLGLALKRRFKSPRSRQCVVLASRSH